MTDLESCARAAIPSIDAASYPCSANSSIAAFRIASRLRSPRGVRTRLSALAVPESVICSRIADRPVGLTDTIPSPTGRSKGADMQLSEKTALLTGASSGIGHQLALELARRGATLALAARRRALLEQLAEQIARAGAPRPVVLEADLSKRGSAATLASAASAALGRIDVVINNAASNLHGCPSAVGDREEARELFELNVWSPMALVHELVPEMRERGGGKVVNVTSLATVAPFPAVGHYCASKAALSLATRSLRLELRGTGVGVL